MFSLTALRTPAITCHANVPSLSLSLSRSEVVEVVLDAGDTDTAADVAVPAIVVTEIEQAVDHRRQDADAAVNVHNHRVVVDDGAVDRSFVETSLLPTQFGFEAEATEVVTSDQVGIEAKLMVENDAVIDVDGRFDRHQS